MTSANQDLLQKAGAQLLDAAGMLRIEANEWLSRKNSVPRTWPNGMSQWSSRCERIAETNNSAATAFEATAKKIAAAKQEAA